MNQEDQEIVPGCRRNPRTLMPIPHRSARIIPAQRADSVASSLILNTGSPPDLEERQSLPTRKKDEARGGPSHSTAGRKPSRKFPPLLGAVEQEARAPPRGAANGRVVGAVPGGAAAGAEGAGGAGGGREGGADTSGGPGDSVRRGAEVSAR